MSSQVSYILIYKEAFAGVPPTWVGVWRGSYPHGDESIGMLVRQGLAGFGVHAVWSDLVGQLESGGFQREAITVAEVMQIGQDIVRISFLASGQIDCQWFTRGPDDNARAADKPIAMPAPVDN